MKIYFKILSIVFGFLIFPLALHAGASTPVEEDVAKVEVFQLDPEFSVDDFSGPNYKIRTFEEQQKADPDPEHRDHIFAISGLDYEVLNWDVPEKDILYLQLRALPIEKLKAIYPKLSAVHLLKAKKELAGSK